MSKKRKNRKVLLSTTDVIPRSVMASTKIVNKEPIHDETDFGLPLKNSFSMLEAYNLVYGTTLWNKRNGFKLYPYQLKFLWKVIEATCNRKNTEIFNLCARQSGKTSGIGATIYTLSVLPTITSFFNKEGMTIAIFAPKLEQSRKVMRQFKNYINTGWATENIGLEITVDNKDEVLLNNGVLIQVGSASINAKPEGQTANALIIEEAQDVDDLRIKKSLFPMTAHTGGARILSGTPTPERRGYFYQRLKELTLKHDNVIYAPYTEAMKYSKNYRNYINRELRSGALRKDSIEFKTQFELLWVDNETRFIDEQRLFALRTSKYERITETDIPVFIGIDVAKRMDTSVMTIISPTLNKFRIINWKELHGKYTNQAKDAINIISKYQNISSIVIDTFGAGEGFADILSDIMETNGMNPDIIIRKPMNTVNKSSIYKNLKKVLDNMNIEYPEEECIERLKFEQEMLNLVVKWNGNNMNPEAPRGMHDDYPDSLALAMSGMRFVIVEDPDELISFGEG